MYFVYILFAIFIFGILILVHELGHFMTAKLFHVKVNEFSMFMGPAIWKKQKGETLYAIRTIPLGGYCAMEGEDGESTDPRAFANAKWWQKVIVLAAGATMNFIAGFLMLMLLAGCFSGYAQMVDPVLDSVEPGSAMEGVLLPGDKLYEIDGERVYTANDVTMLLSLHLNALDSNAARDPADTGDYHDVTVIRNGEKLLLEDVNMEPRMLPLDGEEVLRYGFNMTAVERTFGRVLSYSWNSCLNYGRTVRLSLQMIFQGQVGLKDVSGPVGIVKTMADIGQQSGSPALAFWNSISLGAFLAVNLGIMNLLPIPALDGGRIVGVLLTSLIEKITRKKINPKVEGYIHAGGMAILMLFMIFILFKDVIQLIL